MDSYYFLEEELISKMHTTFINKFNLDNFTATELSMEIMEIFRVSGPDLRSTDKLTGF